MLLQEMSYGCHVETPENKETHPQTMSWKSRNIIDDCESCTSCLLPVVSLPFPLKCIVAEKWTVVFMLNTYCNSHLPTMETCTPDKTLAENWSRESWKLHDIKGLTLYQVILISWPADRDEDNTNQCHNGYNVNCSHLHVIAMTAIITDSNINLLFHKFEVTLSYLCN